jgi:LAS seventeen-binding protein 1/2
MGKVHGKQALFPSSYVQKLPSNASTPAAAAQSEKPVYRPFGAAYHGVDKPPPAEAGTVNSVGLQEAPGTEEKKSKFGKYGNTVGFTILFKLSGGDVINIIDGPFGRWRCRFWRW